MNSSELTMPNLYVCTSCYEYKMDRFERIQAPVGDQQLSENDDQSAMEPLDIQGDFEICASPHSAENELTMDYDRHADKDIINNVLCILKIEEIVDM